MWVALGVADAACHFYDTTATPNYGFVRVEIKASGGDLDADGYAVTLDDAQTRTFRDVGVESFYVASGDHTVSISNVAANCSVAGAATRTVSVADGLAATVTFEVVCVATGITVIARTTGADSPARFPVAVDNAPPVLIPANGGQTFGRLTPGSHQVTLMAPANCTVVGGNSIAVAVAASEVTEVALEVSCKAVVRLPRIAYAIDTLINGISVRSIELVNVDGTGVTSLQEGDAPAWSPDGIRLAFSDAFCPSGSWGDYYFDCSGGIVVTSPEIGDVTTLASSRNGSHPTWSPTGSAIVFQDLASAPDVVLFVLETLTSASARLTVPGPKSASQPAWSPTGLRIAFACRWPTYLDICVANADGTGAVQLTRDEEPDQEPAWSPDGRKLAFARYPPGGNTDANASIAVMDLGTGQVTLVGPGADPAWSPDGTKLVVAGTDGLFVMNADGTWRTRLTRGPHHAPAWRP